MGAIFSDLIDRHNVVSPVEPARDGSDNSNTKKHKAKADADEPTKESASKGEGHTKKHKANGCSTDSESPTAPAEGETFSRVCTAECALDEVGTDRRAHRTGVQVFEAGLLASRGRRCPVLLYYCIMC